MKYSVAMGDCVRDKPALLGLWTDHLPGGRLRAEARYRWIYEQNPDGRPFVWLARDSSGTPIGASCVTPRRLMFHGRELMVGQAIDLVVEPEHRRLLPALLLQRNIIRDLPETGLDALFGFATERAEKVFLRAGYRVLGRLERSSRLLKSRARLRAVLPWKPLLRPASWILDAGFRMTFDLPLGARSRGVVGEVTDRVHPSVDELWEICGQGSLALGVRDREFLSWRFGPGPGESRFYHLLTDNGSLVGYVAFATAGPRVHIKDFLSTDHHTLRSLLTSFAAWAGSQEMETVSASFLGSPPVNGILRRCGFFPRERDGTVLVHFPPTLDPAFRAELKQAQHWFLTIADRDV